MSEKKNKIIRILIADDQELVSIGLRTIFQSTPDMELVGVAETFEEAVDLSRKNLPDIVLFDCMLQEGSCNGRIPELLNVCSSCKILILTACQNRERHLLALRHGAVGVFTLNHPVSLLLKAIHKVYSGQVWLSNTLSAEMLRGFNKSDSSAENIPIVNTLTTRELTIARLSAQGLMARQIADKLYISEKTVRNQLVIIYSKLGIHSHIELMLHAPRLDLL